MRKHEEKLFVPTGKMISINGHKLHIYAEGHGKETLVFMAGSGTASPVLDFKAITSLFSKEYRIVIVEKAGYGFSDISDTSRDIQTMLEETRMTLELAGEKGPYILFPHSMSGIEALYWAQKHPNEVKAIIGLDPAVPQVYEELKVSPLLIKGLALLAKTGIARVFPKIVDSSAAIKNGNLTAEEIELYRIIFHQRTLTKPMLNEVKTIKENANIVKMGGFPDVPMLFFISDGSDIGMPGAKWQELLIDYGNGKSNFEYQIVDAPHYLHTIKMDEIFEKSKIFIDKISK